MTEPRPKTLAEHGDFLREMVKLQLWFIWRWRRLHPEEPFQTVIRTRVDIFRKTALNKGPSKNTATAGDFTLPEWLALEARAEQLCAAAATAEAFENLAWEELFRSVVEARVERDFAEGDGLDNYQCGSLRYSVPKPGKTRVSFHIGNRISPRSIFADPAYLPGCFFELMEAVERLGATELCTGTWLNSFPKWLALFPPEWQARLTPCAQEVGWSQGHWGQFVNARGTFNARHGALMRQTGRLPFPNQASWCEIPRLRAHLYDFLKRGPVVRDSPGASSNPEASASGNS